MIVGGSGGSYDVQIAALQRDNQLLIQQRNLAQTSDQRAPVVAAAELRLAEARAGYAETHPDVILAKQALAEAKRLAQDTSEKLRSAERRDGQGCVSTGHVRRSRTT